ncbi:MAG TPA: serine hydrolase domain-containing protein [Acidobacteriaceae bacterium]|nr:serine hydrolase domain-containing protein [Acidobacteriaceae bacterium]
MRLSRSVLWLCLAVLVPLTHAQAPQLPVPGPKPTSSTQPVPLPPPNPKTPPQLTAQDVTAFLDGFLPLQLQRDDVAGATISIYQNGQPLILKGYGYADFKKKTAVDPVATTFRPGSISKLFTYVSMMQLVEQGKLNLDANVQQYLDFKINPAPRGIGDAAITLRNLATHTAGFEEELHDFGSDKSGKLPVDIRTFFIRNQPHRFAAPGKDLAYSNYGITLIGYIVQRVSGEPFVDYVQHHIFTPLGMTHSTFQQPLPKGFVATKGYLHTSVDDTGFEGVTEVPAGGLSSTAADMAIFGQMLLGHGTYNGVQILQPASVALLLTPQFTPGPGVSPWDLGFYDDDRNGIRFIGHGGDLLACHSQFWIEPTHGLSFFISYNSQGAAQKARQELFDAFVDRYLPGPPNAHPAYVKLTAKQLHPYTGWFLSSRREESTIFRLVGLQPKEIAATKDGNLTISTAKDFYGHPVDFHPLGNDSFYDENDQSTIHFERNVHGRVTGYATPSHSDRAPLLAAGEWLNIPLIIAVGTMLLLVIAALVRSFRRIFQRKRAKLAPQPGTAWATFAIQLAAFAVIALLVDIAVIVSHVSEVSSFYQIGHLDPWLRGEVALAIIVFITLIFGFFSAVRALTRPLRMITKLKFAVVIFSCVYLGWFLLFFHLMSSPTRF